MHACTLTVAFVLRTVHGSWDDGLQGGNHSVSVDVYKRSELFANLLLDLD